MSVKLLKHQSDAIQRMHDGCILCGGVGTGKSITSLAYFLKEHRSSKLYIITTARKRDTREWQEECVRMDISSEDVVVDSWNNIQKYVNVSDAFFIFDEQRVVGSGAWTKAFIKIAKGNHWVLLSATPGDCWMDYVPVFIANGFYKNRTEFVREHVVYKNFSKYPQIDKYLNTGRLIKYRRKVLVLMEFERKTVAHHETIMSKYDKSLYKKVLRDRWNPFKEEPIKDAAGLCYVLRRIVNESEDRIDICTSLIMENQRCIIFYNFDYELDALRCITDKLDVLKAEWNGHKHESVPDGNRWVYLVQYTAGAEAWNCTTTNVIIFYSQNYSYKTTKQASGRIDRMNTPYIDLYYYHLRSNASIDIAIQKALKNKRNFNERMFFQ
nr:MAG TPA: Chromatin remodeling complex ATPase [Caudoviricetes sp.]